MPRTAWLLVLSCLVVDACGPQLPAADRIVVEVSETAGIRRFGYPVEVRFRLPWSVAGPEQLFLLDETEVMPAQFTPLESVDRPEWCLDASLNLMPYEKRTLVVEHRPDVRSEPPRGGLKLETNDQTMRIRNGDFLAWTVRNDLAGLLESVQIAGVEQLRPARGWLVLVHQGGSLLRLDGGTEPLTGEGGPSNSLAPPIPSPSRARLEPTVLRGGPLAVAARFTFQAPDHDRSGSPWFGVQGQVVLTFPVTKSWVQADLEFDDPKHAVAAASAEVELDLHRDVVGTPGELSTLVDFGGGSQVYLNLGTEDSARLEAVPAIPPAAGKWQVWRGSREKLEPFVVFDPALAPAATASGVCEGWAHLMDRTKCLAAAVEDFAKTSVDSLETNGAGRFQIQRRFANADGLQKKRLRFWLHFVTNPPHLSAATSPQSMQSPLSVRVLTPTLE